MASLTAPVAAASVADPISTACFSPPGASTSSDGGGTVEELATATGAWVWLAVPVETGGGG